MTHGLEIPSEAHKVTPLPVLTLTVLFTLLDLDDGLSCLCECHRVSSQLFCCAYTFQESFDGSVITGEVRSVWSPREVLTKTSDTPDLEHLKAF